MLVMRFEDWFSGFTAPASKEVVTHFSTVYDSYKGACHEEGDEEFMTRTKFARAMCDFGWYLRSTVGGDLVYAGLVVEPMLFRPRCDNEEFETLDASTEGSEGRSGGQCDD